MTWLLTSAFTFTFTFTFVYAYVCPVPLPMPGLCGFADSCYVSTHFRYILTTLVLIRNTFYFTTLKINAYLFFRRGYGKLIV